MKLDKIRFAMLVAYIGELQQRQGLNGTEINRLDELIDIEAADGPVAYPSTSDINELMRLMAAGTQKIEAIKVYRKLTGWGLKDSKEEVERHWKSAPDTPDPKGGNLDAANFGVRNAN